MTASDIPVARTILEARGVKRHFPQGASLAFWRDREKIKAVDGISFRLVPGETLSIVGESGCGKTTLARMLLDLDRPTVGCIRFEGEDVAALPKSDWKAFRLSVQAVFQDPTSSLDPKRRIRDIIAEPLLVNTRLRGAVLDDRIAELLQDVGLNAGVATAFPHELSGGMRQRVAIAQALALNPKVIILDEPVSALDVSIRAQIMNLLKRLREEHGITYVMIAHDLGTVRYLSHRVAAMYAGQFVETGDTDALFDDPLHPYTIALISAVGSTRALAKGRIVLSGEPASPLDRLPGCRFQPRCWLCRQIGRPKTCTTLEPELRDVRDGQRVACHFAEELLDPARRAVHIDAARSSALVEEES
ncbi:ABC transporter ATP-binding protein [Antarctobacter sp.]|uniref:ABC transporter ATP-binding protein n=1 Tax=Antarctobacter sp. TaxID=1872577 RepID=UPI003A8D84A4